ncbi:MAG: hypothetical protein JSR84_13215 [Proteobacteria bacterium]|nr:hypothetical protein [Pseudomonadota bacterium]
MPSTIRIRFRRWPAAAAALALSSLLQAQTAAQGGLYIAGDGFSFRQAADRGLAQNPGGQRFFVLLLPPETAAALRSANPAQARLRERVQAGNGQLLVCRRDLDRARIATEALADGVAAVRGFAPAGSPQLPHGERYFPDEDPARLPASNEALRRLRSTCS